MSNIVLSCDLIGGRHGELDTTAERQYTDRYLVVVSTPTAGFPTILTECWTRDLIPAPGESQTGDTLAWVEKYSGDQDSTSYQFWTISVEYHTRLRNKEGNSPSSPQEDPTARGPIWTYDTSPYTEAITYDLDNNAIANSAGCPIVPPLEITYADTLATVTSYKAAWNPTGASALVGKLNLSPFGSFAPGTAKYEGATSRDVWIGGAFRKEITQKVLVRSGGWNPVRLVSAGLMVRDDNGELVVATDKWGHPYSQPILLDANGKQTDTPLILEFTIFDGGDFPSP